MKLEKIIQNKAIELGYEKCGIITLKDLEGYDQYLNQRMEKVPASKMFYQGQMRLTDLKKRYPWAQSVIVAVSRYGHYKIPEQLKDRIAKYYVVDGRENPECEEFKTSVQMEKFIKDLGLKTAENRKFGVVGLRWAAMKAGLGIVRKNNFFYTESGSWVNLEAWIVDKEMELLETNELKPCPQGCSNCIKACPTCSLSASYTMNPVTCISFLTTHGDHQLAEHPLAKKFGTWVYGCDACQDVCPMNRGKWEQEDEFPGARELAEYLSPEYIMEMEEEFYKRNIQPKFFYLSPEELWKWKVNVLNFMGNNYREEYRKWIIQACDNENERVRDIAFRILSEI